MSIKLCKSWVENKNARCEKRAMWGTNYCWWHYPKKEPIITLMIGAFLGLFVTLIFYDPLAYFLSKYPLFYHLDKKAPLVENVIPDVTRLQSIDKTTKFFKVSFTEKDSGLNSLQSYIKISYKDKEGDKSLQGVLKRTNSELNFALEKELKYGEYLFDATLVDRANNKSEFKSPFVVREKDELIASVGYDTYENASDSDREIFSSFIENNKESLKYSKLYIYKLGIGNKDNIANLKDVYLHIEMPDEFRCWEQVGNYNATKAEIYGTAAESFDKRTKGHIYMNLNYLKLKEIGPDGAAIFLILASRTILPLASKEQIW